MTRTRSLLPSLALAAALSLLTLAALEVALRAKAFRDDARAMGDLEAIRRGTSAPQGRARLGHIIRIAANPRIIYELIPNLNVDFLNTPLRTNADGFRGPAVAAAPGERTVRLVGLGDSVMFGWSVLYEDSYLARLTERLRKDFPGASWETVNTAVPGYNTVMEVATLKEKALRYRPDVVVINYVGNDLGLPNFIVGEGDYFSLGRSFLLDFVRSRLRGSGPEPGPRLLGVPAEMRRLGLDGASADKVPARYRGMVGLPAWRGAMRELKALSEQHGFEVVVLAHPEAQDFVRELAAELGFPVVETKAAVEQYVKTHGPGEGESSLTISPADPHPSPLGHEIIAGVLHEHFVQSGLARRLLARREGPGR